MYAGEGNGTPLQYSCLENPMNGGARWAAIHGVTKNRTQLSDFTFAFHFHALEKAMAIHSSVLAWRIPGTGEAWWAAVYGVTQSRTRPKWLSNSRSKDVCKKKKICKGKGRKMLELCPQKQVELLRWSSFRLNELKGECAGILLWGQERMCL